jgi:hypothetical protein
MLFPLNRLRGGNFRLELGDPGIRGEPALDFGR